MFFSNSSKGSGIESYKKRCTQRTKAGNLMARQAHMELVIANNV
eukprot:COSAG01_NODE_76029_length_190_cov_485.604396_1_plen_43_part_01